MTRWITKWTQWVDGLCQLYKFPDPGGDVVGPAYVGLYGLWFVCAGVERASREGSSYIYTSSTLTSR